jgi:hypothetical protein
VGSRYDDFCAEDGKAVNHPLDKTLTPDNLKSLVLTKPRTFATGENNRSHAKASEIYNYVNIVNKAGQAVIACLSFPSVLE